MKDILKTFDIDESTNIICFMKHGSHLYGLDTESSDIDYKGVYIPSKESLFNQDKESEIRASTGSFDQKNNAGDIDLVLYSLPKFIKMLIAGETIAVDMIHCNKKNLIFSTSAWEDIQSHREKSYSKDMRAFLGYVKKQAYKYGTKGSRVKAVEDTLNYLKQKNTVNRLNTDQNTMFGLEGLSICSEHIKYFEPKVDSKPNDIILEVSGSKYTQNTPIKQVIESLTLKLDSYGHRAKLAKENKEIDWKAISHAFRCAYQLQEIFESGDLTYPLKQREFLLSVKRGELDFISIVEPELTYIIEEIDSLAQRSRYPNEVDSKFFRTLCTNIVEENIK